MLLVNVLNDSSIPYDQWTYPTLSKAHILSYSNSSTQPELVEICNSTFVGRCNNTICTLVIGVMGLSKTSSS
jgi:hypothetical protein